MVYSKLLKKYNLSRPIIKEKLLYSMGLFVLFWNNKIWSCCSPLFGWQKDLVITSWYFKISFIWWFFIIHSQAYRNENLLHRKAVIVTICPVPNLQGDINWDKESENLKNKIINELSKTIMPNLEETICDIFWMNPKDFKWL